MKRIAIYPGTFDPITKGHENIITRAGALCDLLYVAIAHGYHKKPLFSIEERQKMAEVVCADLQTPANVKVISFDGLLIKTCQQLNARLIIRGIRTTNDFEYEAQLATTNQHLDPQIETVFLITDNLYSFVSSSIIRETAQLGGDISPWVHTFVKKNLTLKL